jgi:hypothetical protein
MVFRWKLFHRCYGIGDEASFAMEINTWPELPLEYGSLDLHFVEICTDSLALYQAGILLLFSIIINVWGTNQLDMVLTHFVSQIHCIGSTAHNGPG